jgi:hypothetical protein
MGGVPARHPASQYRDSDLVRWHPILGVGGDMAKKRQHMTKNQKLDSLRVDIAKVLQAIETLTRRLDAVVPPARKATKKVRKTTSSQPPRTDEDEDDKAASIAD